MRQMHGQLDLMDALAEAEAVLAAADTHYCPHCGLTYWYSPGNPHWTLARQDAEHVEVEPGICLRMAEIRDTLTAYETGTTVPEPHWSKADLRNHIFELRDVKAHVWKLHSRKAG